MKSFVLCLKFHLVQHLKPNPTQKDARAKGSKSDCASLSWPTKGRCQIWNCKMPWPIKIGRCWKEVKRFECTDAWPSKHAVALTTLLVVSWQFSMKADVVTKGISCKDARFKDFCFPLCNPKAQQQSQTEQRRTNKRYGWKDPCTEKQDTQRFSDAQRHWHQYFVLAQAMWWIGVISGAATAKCSGHHSLASTFHQSSCSVQIQIARAVCRPGPVWVEQKQRNIDLWNAWPCFCSCPLKLLLLRALMALWRLMDRVRMHNLGSALSLCPCNHSAPLLAASSWCSWLSLLAAWLNQYFAAVVSRGARLQVGAWTGATRTPIQCIMHYATRTPFFLRNRLFTKPRWKGLPCAFLLNPEAFVRGQESNIWDR